MFVPKVPVRQNHTQLLCHCPNGRCKEGWSRVGEDSPDQAADELLYEGEEMSRGEVRLQ